MAKLSIVKGTTSFRSYVFIQDSSVTTGAGLTGLVYNTASLVAYYVQPGGSATAITLATQTATGAYSSGGFVAVDGTNMPGLYRLDIPNAALTGANSVVVMLKGATNMVPCVLEIELTATDNQTASTGGITNIDATVSSRLASASYTTPLDASGTRSAIGLASANLDTQLDALPTATENADVLLNRDMSAVTVTNARSPINALRLLRNKRAIAASTLTVYKEDDSTSAWTATLTTDNTAEPIVTIDP